MKDVICTQSSFQSTLQLVWQYLKAARMINVAGLHWDQEIYWHESTVGQQIGSWKTRVARHQSLETPAIAFPNGLNGLMDIERASEINMEDIELEFSSKP